VIFHYRAAKEQKKAVKAAKKVQVPPKVISPFILPPSCFVLKFRG
jgi:hypothetical protein